MRLERRQTNARGPADYVKAGADIVGASDHDAAILEGAAEGASTGYAIGGPIGLGLGALTGILGASSPSQMPWLDPAVIGAFGYDVFVLMLQRGYQLWDPGAMLIARTSDGKSVLTTPAANVVREVLTQRPKLRAFGNLGDGTFGLPPEVENGCFMFAQVYGLAVQPWGGIAVLQDAQTYDLDDFGEELLLAVRETVRDVIKGMIGTVPMGITLGAKTPAMSATAQIRPSFVRQGAAKAATANIPIPRRRIRQAARPAPSSPLPILLPLAAAAALLAF